MRATLIAAVFLALGAPISAHAAEHHPDPAHPLFRDVVAFVTGYNTVPAQTDDTPCIAASGLNICGRTDAVACPRQFNLGTVLEIRGMLYVCEDRLARKYDSRFDISCDKDTDCPGQVTGWATIRVFAIRRATPENPVATAPPPAADAMIEATDESDPAAAARPPQPVPDLSQVAAD